MGQLYENIIGRETTNRDSNEKILSAYDQIIGEEREGKYFKKGDKIKFTAPNGKKLTGTVVTGDIMGKLKVMPDEPNASVGGGKKAKAEILVPTKSAKKINEGKMAGWIAIYNSKKLEIKKDQAKDLYGAKQIAIKHFKVPKSKQGLLAIEPAYDD